MADDKMQPDPGDRPQQANPTQSGHNEQQLQRGVPKTPAPESQPLAPGRKPLFRS